MSAPSERALSVNIHFPPLAGCVCIAILKCAVCILVTLLYFLPADYSTSEMLVNMGNLPLDEFYPAVSMVALMRIFRDQSLSQHHTMVVQAITFIFKSLGLKCVQFLPQVMPTFLNVIRVCDGAIREVSVAGMCFSPACPRTEIHCKENMTSFGHSCTVCVAAKHAAESEVLALLSFVSKHWSEHVVPPVFLLLRLLLSILLKWPAPGSTLSNHSAQKVTLQLPQPSMASAVRAPDAQRIFFACCTKCLLTFAIDMCSHPPLRGIMICQCQLMIPRNHLCLLPSSYQLCVTAQK